MNEINLYHAKCVSVGRAVYSMLIRKNFRINAVKSASLTVASFGFFYGYLNGKPISEEYFQPLSTDFHARDMVVNGIPFDEELGHRLYCPVYDVTALLQSGENTLSFAVGAGWYAHDGIETPRYGEIKLAYCLELTHTDGSVERIVSDGREKAAEGFAVQGDILTGETHDYTDYDGAWVYAGFDDSTWAYAVTEDLPQTALLAQDCPADKVIRKIKPVKIAEGNGAVIYDVGETVTGFPLVFAHGGEVNLRYAERLNPDFTLSERNIYGQHTRILTDRPITVDTQFTWYCFRYFEVRGACKIGEVLVIHSDVSVTSSFTCDNETLNWLYGAFLRTQLANMHCGIPSDCPHIERKGYTGDGQLTARAAMTLMDAQAFYKKWIYDIADCQDRKTGHVQYTAPYLYAGGGPGGWGGAIVLVPYDYYRHYGDTALLRELYPQMLRYFDYMEAHSENGLVVSDREGSWCLGEWCTPDQVLLNAKDGILVPPPFINTYFYIKTMQRVLEIEQILGIAPSELLQTRIQCKQDALVRRYFDDRTGDFCENKQGANAFALDIGLGDARTLANMISRYRTLGRYDTGIFGTELVTRLLFERGYADVALGLLTSKDEISFYRQMQTGATTMFENWNGVRSQCHPMFGAVNMSIVEYVLGIRQTGVGYESVVIAPACMDTVKRASGHITTPRGVIAVAYDEAQLRVSLPEGMQAQIHAPGRTVTHLPR